MSITTGLSRLKATDFLALSFFGSKDTEYALLIANSNHRTKSDTSTKRLQKP